MRTRCGKRGWLRAVLAAALCLTLASPQMNLFAQKVEETDKTCSLTVDAAGSDEEYAEDLKKAEITVKLYQIATITGTGRHKTVERFESLEQDLEKIMDEGGSTAAAWEDLAQKAAKTMGLRNEREAAEEQKEPAAEPGEADQTISVTDGSGTVSNLPAGMYLVWTDKVQTGAYEYLFQPYLIALPNRDAVGEEWVYDVTVNLKTERQARYGALRITKKLENYHADKGDAMFIFQVEAVKDNETVYSNVVQLDMTKAGTESILIEKIPVGAKVTVTEIYSGAAYELTAGEKTQVVEIPPRKADDGTEQSAEVSFTNDYNGKHFGTGVVNQFDSTSNAHGWTWKKIVKNQVADSQGVEEEQEHENENAAE